MRHISHISLFTYSAYQQMKLHIWHVLWHISLHILWHIYWHIMHNLHILHILHIYAWWYMLQVFVVYFLNFQKNKNDRTWKTDNYPPAKLSNNSYISCAARGVCTLVVSTETCCPTNSATDPLGNPHSIIALFPSWGWAVHVPPPALSLPSLFLLQEAPGMSAASLCISYGIVPVLQTGTRGSLPSMEDT